jgi:putative ABC transport system substrate-binding protein
MTGRRQFVFALSVGALGSPFVSFAQAQRTTPRVGFLISELLSGQMNRVDALRAGLRDRGYVEGKNITIVIRSADGKYDRLPELAVELSNLKVEVIVAFGTKAVTAAMQATSTIPIVDPVMGDPVASGLSNSLARPGGNVTGSTQFGPEAAAKRVELLNRAVPRIARVGVLINPANPGSTMQVQAMRAAADALKMQLRAFEVRAAGELTEAFSAMAMARIEAIVVATDTLFRANAAEVARLAAKQRLPSCGPKEFAAAGGLIGYGADDADTYRHAAYFVDKILKGAKPGDLPIEQSTELLLVVNIKTAKALGITVPPSLLSRADEVIQ